MGDLVSIITPAYNCERFIAEMIESILAQTYPDWELLITDDCSTDRTVSIISDYCKRDGRIKLFVLEKNSGAGVARNNSIKQASGRYIAVCDSDDMWKPRKLEREIAFMRENGYSFVSCNTEIIDQEGKTIGFRRGKKRSNRLQTIIIDRVETLGAMYDASVIGKCYMPKLRKRQDWALWIDVLSKTDYCHTLDEDLILYRLGNRNSLSAQKFKLPKYHIAVYHDYLGMPKIGAFLLFYCVSLPCIAVRKLSDAIYSRRKMRRLKAAKML